jgi:hypothetical protein
MNENGSRTPTDLAKLDRQRRNRAARQRDRHEWVQSGAVSVPWEQQVEWVANALQADSPEGSPCPCARAMWAWASRNAETREKFWLIVLGKLMMRKGPPAGEAMGFERDAPRVG